MDWEYSCGAIVFTRRNDQILYVIVQELAGAYSFPKGHMEGDETEMETARREAERLKVETAKIKRESEEYHFQLQNECSQLLHLHLGLRLYLHL